MPDSVHLSIIIPVLNEAEHLHNCLMQLFAASASQADCEVIVCDGGSSDETLAVAAKFPCRLLTSTPGRAVQMNLASRHAHGQWLLFLHADSCLPVAFIDEIDKATDWGYFRLRLSGQHFLFPVIGSAINLRSALTRVAGGDQALFFRNTFFHSINGYPQIPLMEDIAICKTARRLARPYISKHALLCSSRRWRQNGVVKTILLMWSIRLAYWLGVNPLLLHKFYYPQRGQ